MLICAQQRVLESAQGTCGALLNGVAVLHVSPDCSPEGE